MTTANQNTNWLLAATLAAFSTLFVVVAFGPPAVAQAQEAATSSLTVVKEVVNDDAGTATSSDFTIEVVNQSTGTTTASFTGSADGTTVTVDQGVTYAISESGTTTADYTPTFSGDCDADGTVTPAATTTTCTITNNDEPEPTATSTLTILKEVINDDGGAATSSDFTIDVINQATGTTTASVAGSAAGTDVTINASTTYQLSETATTSLENSYQPSFAGDCDAEGLVLLAAGESGTCTIANDDQGTSTLTIFKEVINDNDGTATSSDFTIDITNQATGSSTASFNGSATGTDVTLFQGVTYEISETGTTTTDYMPSFAGDCSADGTITPTAATATCTITNDDDAPEPSPPSGDQGGGGDLLGSRGDVDDDDDDDADDDNGDVLGERDEADDDDGPTDAELRALLEEARQRLLGLLASIRSRMPGLPGTGDGSLFGW